MTDTLRPSTWDQFVGQPRMKRELEIRIDSALADDRPMDHTLLCATPGAGKTALAEMMAERLDYPLMIVNMPITPKALVRIVNSHSGLLALDEIHIGATTRDGEALLPLLEFGIVYDNGKPIQAGWLTVVGMTTERQKLPVPLRDRFPVQPIFESYTDEDMAMIVAGMGDKAGLKISGDACQQFGVASAGTPRQARKFVLGYRDLTNHLGRKPTPAEVLELCAVEWDGITQEQMRYLTTLDALGGTKGVDVLAALMSLSKPEIHQMEKLLVDRGLVGFTEQGRDLTQAGTERARANNDFDLNARPTRKKAA